MRGALLALGGLGAVTFTFSCAEDVPRLPPATDNDVCAAPAVPMVIRAPLHSVVALAPVPDGLFFMQESREGRDLHQVQSIRWVAADGSGERAVHTLPPGTTSGSPLHAGAGQIFFLVKDGAGPRVLVQSVPEGGGPIGQVGVFDPPAGSRPALFSIDAEYLYLAAARGGGAAERGGLYRLSRLTGEVAVIARIDGAIHDAQLSDGQIWYRGNEDQKVYRVPADASSGSATTVMVPSSCRHRVAGGGLYCGSTGTLTRFDPQTRQVRRLIDVGPIHHPQVAPVFEPVDSDGDWLYVVERRSGAGAKDLRRVDLRTFAVEFVTCRRDSIEHLRAVAGGAVWSEIVFGATTAADQLVRLAL